MSGRETQVARLIVDMFPSKRFEVMRAAFLRWPDITEEEFEHGYDIAIEIIDADLSEEEAALGRRAGRPAAS